LAAQLSDPFSPALCDRGGETWIAHSPLYGLGRDANLTGDLLVGPALSQVDDHEIVFLGPRFAVVSELCF
jgi:hypothetical protein